jgi:hypothetical protein
MKSIPDRRHARMWAALLTAVRAYYMCTYTYNLQTCNVMGAEWACTPPSSWGCTACRLSGRESSCSSFCLLASPPCLQVTMKKKTLLLVVIFTWPYPLSPACYWQSPLALICCTSPLFPVRPKLWQNGASINNPAVYSYPNFFIHLTLHLSNQYIMRTHDPPASLYNSISNI